MVGEEPGAPQYDVILAVAVAAVAVAPFVLGGTEALTEFITELFSPIGLLFLPVTLIFIIRFLSSERGTCLSEILSGGSPDSMRAGGSPIGPVLVLLLLFFFLYYRTFLNGGGGGDDEE